MSSETAIVPVIDMRAITHLAETSEQGGQVVTEIIDAFLADLSERVHAIGLQMSRDDRAQIAATAHAIKGSCAHFGAARLMELSGEIEGRVRHGEMEGLQTAIVSMIAETERVRAALEAFRSGQLRGTDG